MGKQIDGKISRKRNKNHKNFEKRVLKKFGISQKNNKKFRKNGPTKNYEKIGKRQMWKNEPKKVKSG